LHDDDMYIEYRPGLHVSHDVLFAVLNCPFEHSEKPTR
jgi:hypothetical protein